MRPAITLPVTSPDERRVIKPMDDYEMSYSDCVTDEECDMVYHREIARANRRNPQRYDCPDCGAKRALSAWQKQQGHHCNACTRRTESGY
jgi:DNA-directed RNA polymerase subunit RPC12/RpoP